MTDEEREAMEKEVSERMMRTAFEADQATTEAMWVAVTCALVCLPIAAGLFSKWVAAGALAVWFWFLAAAYVKNGEASEARKALRRMHERLNEEALRDKKARKPP